MLNTLIALIIFATPFCLIPFFKDRTAGVLIIFTANLFLHMLVALATQSLRIFNYQTIISFYIAVSVACLLYYIKNKSKIVEEVHHTGQTQLTEQQTLAPFEHKSTQVKQRLLTKQNLLVSAAFFTVFLNLAFVHYNFTGTVNSVNGSYEVENAHLPYPYFSDEWVAIAFVNYAIENQSLPVVNPLHVYASPNIHTAFNDPLAVYFSFLSDIFLFFKLNALNYYEFLTLLVGLAICISFFILLRSMGISKNVSVMTLLVIPYITNGGNLPGIWFLIPMTFALIFFVISLIGYVRKSVPLFLLASIFCLCLYPPFIAFVAPVILVFIVNIFIAAIKNRGFKTFLITASVTVFAVLLATFIGSLFVFNGLSFSQAYIKLVNYLIRTNLVGGILYFPIWVVLPVFALILSIFGFMFLFKKRMYFIILPLIIGLFYWLFYTYSQIVFIIDAPRVVVITSFLLLIPLALAVDYLFTRFLSNKLRTSATILFVICAFVLSFTYTENDSWTKLMLHYNSQPEGVSSYPAPTASVFLTDEDLKLFGKYTKKTFISPPWKGLTIGAATGNYPLHSKPSTIGVFTQNYNDFLNDADCQKKRSLSIELGIDLVYSGKFECPNFKLIGTNTEEDLYLYQFVK